MLVSPFTFYRGAAMIMAHDLAATQSREKRAGDRYRCSLDGALTQASQGLPPRRTMYGVRWWMTRP
ncbi:MAG: DUF2252 family protein [Solirubrobacteraceae bacterium]